MGLHWTQVRDELAEAVRMSRRMPGAGLPWSGGRATDGPWHLILPESLADGDFDAWRKEREEAIARDLRNSPRDVPLLPEEVSWMERRIEWLGLIADQDRKLVWLAIVQVAGDDDGEPGERAPQIDWGKVRRRLPVEIGRKGLYRRFVRALQALAQRLDEGEARRAA